MELLISGAIVLAVLVPLTFITVFLFESLERRLQPIGIFWRIRRFLAPKRGTADIDEGQAVRSAIQELLGAARFYNEPMRELREADSVAHSLNQLRDQFRDAAATIRVLAGTTRVYDQPMRQLRQVHSIAYSLNQLRDQFRDVASLLGPVAAARVDRPIGRLAPQEYATFQELKPADEDREPETVFDHRVATFQGWHLAISHGS